MGAEHTDDPVGFKPFPPGSPWIDVYELERRVEELEEENELLKTQLRGQCEIRDLDREEAPADPLHHLKIDGGG